MRTTPIKNFGQNIEPKEPPVQAAPPPQAEVFDIMAHLKTPTQLKPTVAAAETEQTEAPATQPPAPTNEKADAGPDQPNKSTVAPEFDEEKFKEFEKKAERTVESILKDPKKFTSLCVTLLDMGRMMVYPWIYERILFESHERREIVPLLKKVAQAKRESRAPVLNPYEKELLARREEFAERKKGIPYTEKEVELLVSHLHEKLAQMPIAQLMEKYDWVLILLFVEGSRFAPLIGDKMKAKFNS